ncbi:glycosyltransferase family 39 protein [Pontibacter ruber]|uniref:Glycosyltransferase family 39 protein n=1 Tax=Pontibacter ruber TaxID=1343895 RepID=A0ABW5CW66_9BACT|nr:glycosyltransferase family 39 protein [Pontibacter ruber]
MAVKDILYQPRTVGLLLLLLFALSLYNLGSWGVIETSEARYAEISREMLLSQHWLHPRLLGILHYHKPTATYIITAFGMELFGFNPFGARFFLQVSLVLQALLVYLLGQLIFQDRRTAFTALVIYITTLAVLISARNLTTDSFLTTFELAAIWAWIKYKKDRKAGWLYFFSTLLALAFLTKGPVGLIFPVLVALAYNPPPAVPRQKSFLPAVTALLLFLLIGGSWYVYLMLQDRQFVDYFLLKHTVQRFVNPEAFSRSKPWWFYLVLAPVLSLPWSAILLFNIRKIKLLPASQKRLFLFWVLIPLIFFSFSGSKLILYILPLFAGQALFTAGLLPLLEPGTKKMVLRWGTLYFVVLAVALLVAPWLPVGVVLPTWAYLLPLLILVFILVILKSMHGPVIKLLYVSLVFTLLLLPYSTHLLERNPGKYKSGSEVAAFLKSKGLSKRPLIVYDNLLPSLAFHLNRDLVTVYDTNKKLQRETQFERDDRWQHVYLELQKPGGEAALQKLLKQNAVLILKEKIPVNRRWMLQGFKQKQEVGEWQVFY